MQKPVSQHPLGWFVFSLASVGEKSPGSLVHFPFGFSMTFESSEGDAVREEKQGHAAREASPLARQQEWRQHRATFWNGKIETWTERGK